MRKIRIFSVVGARPNFMKMAPVLRELSKHAVQTGEIMRRFEEVCESIKPNLVIVAGDVNSTLACSLTAAKLQIPVAHVEAGLRSFDRSMPEEINRIVTDSVSDCLFTTEESGNQNHRREGVTEEEIQFVGNTMIDSLIDCYKVIENPRRKGRSRRLVARILFLQPFIAFQTLTIQLSYRKCWKSWNRRVKWRRFLLLPTEDTGSASAGR